MPKFRIRKIEDKGRGIFNQIYKYLFNLEIGEFIYIHKEVNSKLSLSELSGDIRGGLQRRNCCHNFEREIIYDPDLKLSTQKILKVTKIK